MKALLTLLLGYTAYRMAVRITDENSSHLLLTDQRPETPQAVRPTRPRHVRAAPPASTTRASATRRAKRR
jgi:hypothetical protein